MKYIFGFCVLFVLVSLSYGAYSSSDDIVELDSSNFRSEVLDSDELWLVEFYAPWCGHCQRLEPEWKRAAKNLKGIANVAAVNMDAHSSVGAPYGIRGFPTIKVFGYDKQSPADYQGARSADAITEHAMQALKDMVSERASGGKKKRSSSGGSNNNSGGGSSDDVVTLTDSNFRELVLDSDETWLVEFYAPWCGHCKNLAPHWARAATEVKEKSEGQVKLGALDATQHQATASKYGIRGYPSIKIFRRNHKDEAPIDYDGGRDTTGIVSKAMEYYEENIEPPTVDEIVNQEVLDEKCTKGICILAFLPDIYEGGKTERNRYINMLTELADKFKKQKWGWGWSAAARQSDLEKTLNVGGSGYPMLVAMNLRKEAFALHMGAFSDNGIRPFLNVLTYGQASRNTFPIPKGKTPVIKASEAWDGEDGPPIEEPDIDLSDFKWDDEL